MAPPPLSPNRNSDDSGCFSAILHRLLCSNGVPTHPTSSELDHPSPSSNKTPRRPVLLADVSSSVDEKPGIVARLMGLETLPDFTTRRRPAVDTVPRSRSVNFMDYLITGTVEHQHHRRVRTSVSFREVIVPLQQKQPAAAVDDLLVLYLDELTAESSSSSLGVPNSSSSSSNSNYKGSSKNAGKELKLQKKKKKKDGKLLRDDEKKNVVVISKLRNKEPVVRGKSSSSISSRVKDGARANHEVEREYNYNGSKTKKKDESKRRAAAGRLILDRKEVVAESNFITKNSSSSKQKRFEDNSALDHHLHNYAYNSTPEKMRSYLRNSSSTSWRVINGCSSPPKIQAIVPERVKERSEKVDSPEITHNYDSVAAAIDHVCKLTEEDMINSNNGFGIKEDEGLSSEYEEICVLIEQRILTIIIQQLVGDLLTLN